MKIRGIIASQWSDRYVIRIFIFPNLGCEMRVWEENPSLAAEESGSGEPSAREKTAELC